MSKTIQMQTTIVEGGVKQQVNGYPITTPDRVIDENGVSVETKLAGKSTVSVSATGTATDVVNYITIDGVQKKLPSGGGASGTTLADYGITDAKIESVGTVHTITLGAHTITFEVVGNTLNITTT